MDGRRPGSGATGGGGERVGRVRVGVAAIREGCSRVVGEIRRRARAVVGVDGVPVDGRRPAGVGAGGV